MPVSTIRSGRVRQMISCRAMMSCGNWMIGMPSHEKWYEYSYSDAAFSQARLRSASAVSPAICSMIRALRSLNSLTSSMTVVAGSPCPGIGHPTRRPGKVAGDAADARYHVGGARRG